MFANFDGDRVEGLRYPQSSPAHLIAAVPQSLLRLLFLPFGPDDQKDDDPDERQKQHTPNHNKGDLPGLQPRIGILDGFEAVGVDADHRQIEISSGLHLEDVGVEMGLPQKVNTVDAAKPEEVLEAGLFLDCPVGGGLSEVRQTVVALRNQRTLHQHQVEGDPLGPLRRAPPTHRDTQRVGEGPHIPGHLHALNYDCIGEPIKKDVGDDAARRVIQQLLGRQVVDVGSHIHVRKLVVVELHQHQILEDQLVVESAGPHDVRGYGQLVLGVAAG